MAPPARPPMAAPISAFWNLSPLVSKPTTAPAAAPMPAPLRVLAVSGLVANELTLSQLPRRQADASNAARRVPAEISCCMAAPWSDGPGASGRRGTGLWCAFAGRDQQFAVDGGQGRLTPDQVPAVARCMRYALARQIGSGID